MSEILWWGSASHYKRALSFLLFILQWEETEYLLAKGQKKLWSIAHPKTNRRKDCINRYKVWYIVAIYWNILPAPFCEGYLAVQIELTMGDSSYCYSVWKCKKRRKWSQWICCQSSGESRRALTGKLVLEKIHLRIELGKSREPRGGFRMIWLMGRVWRDGGRRAELQWLLVQRDPFLLWAHLALGYSDS